MIVLCNYKDLKYKNKLGGIMGISKPVQEMSAENLFGICPYVTTQKLLAGKWSILVMHHLSEGTKRFNELHREMADLTQTTLTKQLRFLEEEGLVKRTVYPEVPPRVEYSLTPIGEQFKIVLDSLEVWGNQYIEYIKVKES